MEVVCPSCKYKGNVKDENIPDSGREVTCPHCKAEFFVRRKEKLEPESEMVGNVVSEPPGGSFKPKVSNFEQVGVTKKPILVCSSLLVTAVIFFVFGFFIGAALFYSDSESDTKISRSDNVVVKPPKTTPPADKESISPKTLFSNRKKVEANKLIDDVLPLSEIQTKKFVEDNLYLNVYGIGTVKDVKVIDGYWEIMLRSNYRDSKYGVEIVLNDYRRRVVIGLSMSESDIMKINKGDKVKFSGKFLNFTNYGGGSAKAFLYDGKVVKD